MVINQNLKTAFNEALKCNFSSFALESLELAQKVFNTPYRVILSPIGTDYLNPKLDVKKVEELINQAIITCPVSFSNEITISLPRENPLDPPFHPRYMTYLRYKDNLALAAEDEFWQNEINVLKYQEMANFDCFIDAILPEKNIQKLRAKGYQWNIQEWNNYEQKLLEENFPGFKFDKSKSGKRLRFLKKIGNFYYGFEWDKNEINRVYKKGEVALSENFNLIAITENFKDIPIKNYLEKNQHSEIVSLGIMGNPFFYPPCYSLEVFWLKEIQYETTINGMKATAFNNKIEYVPVDDQHTLIVHSPELTEKIKRHAYFYMKCLAVSVAPYLSYVERSLNEALIQ